MRRIRWGVLLAGLAWMLWSHAEASDPYWVATARRVHARFTGKPGTFAQFGDSITVTQAFWAPLLEERRNASPEMEAAFRRVKARLRPECWREWKGPEFGSEGGQTVRWADENVAAWLKRLNPEVALIMFGTNDLHSLELPEYRAKLRAVAQRCLENGTVVLLSTLPPRHGFERQAAEFSQAAREVAAELRIPLTDYHAEILKRRPDDWDGAMDQFAAFQGYEVPTLIARDGVHPSFPKRFRTDYSEEALRSSGYTLRNALALLQLAEVYAALDTLPAPQSGQRPVVSGQSPISNLQSPPSNLPKAPPLPAPSGEVIRVTDVPQLHDAAARVRPGGTILLAPGRYPLVARRLELRTDRVTLRGEGGDPTRVVLDGGGTLPEGIALTACSDVTIAELTLQNVRWNGIKINSETGVQRLRIHHCVLRNIWQRAVKGVKVPAADRERLRPRECRVEYCLFVNDRAKQFSDDPADTDATFRGDYIGGIDVMYPVGWTIADNRFVGIRGRTRQARGAVFLWHDARDCVVERNTIVDCDSGICLGNSSRDAETPVHATGCLVRNNMVTRGPENGLLADYTRDCRIVQNTVYDPASRLARGVRVVHDNDGLVVANNLLSGVKVRLESGSRISLRDNAELPDRPTLFRDPARGDLRLPARPADLVPVPRLPEAPDDVDRRPRPPQTTPGAHER